MGFARAQFIDTYANDILANRKQCACGPNAPCQHIASTIIKEATGYGTILCEDNPACPMWDPHNSSSLTYKQFFFCCNRGGLGNPLRTCDLPMVSVAQTPRTSTGTTQTSAEPRTTAQAIASTEAGTTTQNVSEPNTTAQAIASTPLAATVAKSSPAETTSDHPCDVLCLGSISAGVAVLVLIGIAIFTRKARNSNSIPLDDLKDLQNIQRFQGTPGPMPVYAEVSGMSGCESHGEYEYENPVPVYDMADQHTGALAFHNPTYAGPPIPQPIYDSIEENENTPTVFVNEVYKVEEEV